MVATDTPSREEKWVSEWEEVKKMGFMAYERKEKGAERTKKQEEGVKCY